MVKGNAIAIIIFSLVTAVLNVLSFNACGLVLSITVIVFAGTAIAKKDNASLGTSVILFALTGLVLVGSILTKAIYLIEFILACIMTKGLLNARNARYPFLKMSKEEIEREKIRRREEKEALEAEKAEAEKEAEEAVNDTPFVEATVAEEAEGTAEASADEDEEESSEEEPEEEEPVPGLTEEIASEEEENCPISDEALEALRYGTSDEGEDVSMPYIKDGMISLSNTTKEHYESPRNELPELEDPEVMIVRDAESEPEKLALKSYFRRDENALDPSEPFAVLSEEGFGLDKTVKVIRYVLRNRTGKAWKYASWSVTPMDLLRNPIETEKPVDIIVERVINPGEVFVVDIPSKEYGRTRGVEVLLRSAVDSRGDVFRFNDGKEKEKKLVGIPEAAVLDALVGENADEFLADYESEYDLGFTPRYAYTLNPKGSACTCPCCGETVEFEDDKCPLCGAPRDRFVYCALEFMKRQKEKWDVRRAARLQREAEEKARKEAFEKAEKERLDALRKAEENRKNNIKMWSATLIVLLFVVLAWLYYNV